MKTKVYIAGKITGDHNYREKFGSAQKQLEGEGYTVLSPATLPDGMSTADYMRICFAMIDTADVCAFLDDYEKSGGAMVEFAYCKYIGKKTFLLGCKL